MTGASRRLGCDEDEVALIFGEVLALIGYVIVVGIGGLFWGFKQFLQRRERRRLEDKRKFHKLMRRDTKSIAKIMPQMSPKASRFPNAPAAIAVRRLLFWKMNQDFEARYEGSEGFTVANKVRLRRKHVEREPWEVDVRQVRFKKKIGAGNFGEVWVGTWMRSAVAIKTVIKSMSKNGEFVERFKEEIKLMSELQHPNIVMFLGASLRPPTICLILEYCVFGNMIEFLRGAKENEIAVSMHLILKMALDIARGIKYLHEKMSIIQRDLKGRNVLVDENFNAKIADFGLSRMKSEESDAALTACGTPAWTAPEIVRMEEYTEKVDVYSYGVVLWELIMRQEPYEGEGGIQIAYMAAEQGLRPPRPEFAPKVYCDLMEECWADSPDDRPTFSEILQRLFKMMKDEASPAKAAEFYFGPRNFDKEFERVSELLEAHELNEGVFLEDFTKVWRCKKQTSLRLNEH